MRLTRHRKVSQVSAEEEPCQERSQDALPQQQRPQAGEAESTAMNVAAQAEVLIVQSLRPSPKQKDAVCTVFSLFQQAQPAVNYNTVDT